MQEYPKVSIVIPNYNGEEIIDDCIDSILKNNYPNYEIIIIDDFSTDWSCKFIEEKIKNYDCIKLIKNSRNLGPSECKNIGITTSNSDYIATLDNDTIVDKEWLIELMDVMLTNENISGCCSKLYIHNTEGRILNSCGAYLIDIGYGLDIGLFELDEGQYEEVQEVIAGCSAASLYRKNTIEKLNGFDGRFFYPQEDVDIGLQMNMIGQKFLYVPTSKVTHQLSYTMKRSGYKRVYLTERNRIRSFIKNYEIKTMVKLNYKFIKRLVFLYLITLYKENKIKYIYNLTKSILWNIFFISDTLKRRRYIQKIRTVTDKELFDKYILNYIPSFHIPDYDIQSTSTISSKKPIKEVIFGKNEVDYLGYGWFTIQKHDFEIKNFRFMGKEAVILFPKRYTNVLKIELFSVINLKLKIIINNCIYTYIINNPPNFEIVTVELPIIISNCVKITIRSDTTWRASEFFENSDHRNISIGVSRIWWA